jgi:hypothetical protein
MSSLIRIEVLSIDSVLEIKTPGSEPRVFKVAGGDHLTLELERPGDALAVTLIAAAPPYRHKAVPAGQPADNTPIGPSPRAGVYEVDAQGNERFVGSGSAASKKIR